MADEPEVGAREKRLKPLWGQLRPADTPCPFVVNDDAAKHVELLHGSAGRDAIYIWVSIKWDGGLPLEKLLVTIRYAPFIEGTTIIYDLIDETMQGKARPFDCDLSGLGRDYMLLPCQIERILIAVRDDGDNRIVDVAFLDARNEIIQAALPFELTTLDSSGKALESYFATTNRNGKTHRKLPARCSRTIVRSLLTGSEESVSF
jgi:hypothetical protein